MNTLRETALPPLRSLIAAESVVRNNGVTKAAEELHLTSSAVSQQLKVLEGAMKISFFNREKGKISIKPEYKYYFEQISRSMNMMKSASDQLTDSDHYSTLNISIEPSFMSLCLLEALPEYITKNPTIKINTLSNQGIANFGTENIDLSVCYTADTSNPSLTFEKIRDDYLIPCATRSLVDQVGGESIDFFIKNSYLIDDAPNALTDIKPSWNQWFEADLLDNSRSLGFSDYSHALNAGMQGMGAFIARTGLMMDTKLDDSLVPLVDSSKKSGASFYVVYSSDIPLKPHTRLFKNWLLRRFSE